MLRDALGNPVSLHHADSLAPLDDFVMGFIASEARAVNLLATAAHDHSAIVQAYAAALHMFAETGSAPANARPYLQRAQQHSHDATSREQRFVQAVAAWVHGDVPSSLRLLQEQVAQHPRDLVALKLGQYHAFNLGDAPAMLRLALAAAPHAADVPYLHGMLAFAWEQCHAMAQAEAAARHAIQLSEKEPWAHHALAHVMLTQGRMREGLDFMQSMASTWTGLNSFMVTHNWWHAALFAIELGQAQAALELYDTQVWGVEKSYSQDQANAVSLLARLELAGVDVGVRWQDVATYLLARGAEHVLPFLDLHYLYGLARAGRPEAAALLTSLETHAEAHPDQPQWHQTALPCARGLLAYAQGDFANAAQALGQALPQLVLIGGSHAQRDLFGQFHLDALIRSDQWAAVHNLVQPLRNSQPESLRLAQLVAHTQNALGLPNW
ncbi:tetratricopeptide repeat protein [Variovorax sp. HJSM1_2]|uniref:tetratricopeptide repeat protein n=1 Tax=Variovorax sp. HJSM1_2 TaxID=3366263 RepID=UPI003BC26115